MMNEFTSSRSKAPYKAHVYNTNLTLFPAKSITQTSKAAVVFILSSESGASEV